MLQRTERAPHIAECLKQWLRQMGPNKEHPLQIRTSVKPRISPCCMSCKHYAIQPLKVGFHNRSTVTAQMWHVLGNLAALTWLGELGEIRHCLHTRGDLPVLCQHLAKNRASGAGEVGAVDRADGARDAADGDLVVGWSCGVETSTSSSEHQIGTACQGTCKAHQQHMQPMYSS